MIFTCWDLKLSIISTSAQLIQTGVCSTLLPEVDDQLICFLDMEGVIDIYHTTDTTKLCLLIISDRVVVSSVNLKIELEQNLATVMSAQGLN